MKLHDFSDLLMINIWFFIFKHNGNTFYICCFSLHLLYVPLSVIYFAITNNFNWKGCILYLSSSRWIFQVEHTVCSFLPGELVIENSYSSKAFQHSRSGRFYGDLVVTIYQKFICATQNVLGWSGWFCLWLSVEYFILIEKSIFERNHTS